MKDTALARTPSELTDHASAASPPLRGVERITNDASRMTNHAITRLCLENFRNYQSLVLEVTARPVLLVGRNGAGKTNLLEAISLLMPGRGFRAAALRELDYAPPRNVLSGLPPLTFPPPQTHSPRMRGEMEGGIDVQETSVSASDARVVPPLTSPPHAGGIREGMHAGGISGEMRAGGGGSLTADAGAAGSRAWVMHAEILHGGISHNIGTGRAPDSEGRREKRLLKIDGELVRQQSDLTRYVSVWWLTPAMDQLFNEGNSARRKFLDRLVYGFDPAHAARVARYERAMRERNALLAEPAAADGDWLAILEQQMAESAIAITAARQETLAHIRTAMEAMPGSFPQARMVLVPGAEGDIQKTAERLASSRARDAASGRALNGVHRASLDVIHSIKNANAEQCSTGEQKALLLSIMLAAARAKQQVSGTPPVLLLDEVVAHLDVDKRAALFDLISGSAIQAWMTGTDAADFQGLRKFATLLEIADGRVVIRDS